MHSYLWGVRLGKDREYEICSPGGIKHSFLAVSVALMTLVFLQVLTASGENRTGASASIEQQVMLTNPGYLEFSEVEIL